MALSFLVILVGLLTVFRIAGHLIGHGLIPKSEFGSVLRSAAVPWFLVLVLMMRFIPNSAARSGLAWIWSGIIISLICVLPVCRFWKKKRSMDLALEKLLSSLLISMKAGMSLRSSIGRELSIATHSEGHAFLTEINLRLNFKAQGVRQLAAPWLVQFTPLIEEISRLDQEPHLALKALEFIRLRISRSRDLRQRIHRAKLQASMQLVVIMFIYILCLVWSVSSGEVKKSPQLTLFSILWFLFGSLIMWRIGEKQKWNV